MSTQATVVTEERKADFARFQALYDKFQAITKANGPYDEDELRRASFYYLQGIAQAEVVDKAISNQNNIDPVLWIALIRVDIEELNGLAQRLGG